MRHDHGRDQRTGRTTGSAIVHSRRVAERPRYRDRRRLLPTVLNLEDRKPLATFIVDLISDSGVGTGLSLSAVGSARRASTPDPPWAPGPDRIPSARSITADPSCRVRPEPRSFR
jgi:hypothetical protein